MISDDAVSEVIGFSLILAMIILAVAILSVSAVPVITEEQEQSRNKNVLRQFAAFKYDLDTVLAAKNTGVYGRRIISLVPERGHVSALTRTAAPVSPGRLSMERGVPAVLRDNAAYYPVIFTYQSDNRYAENLVVTLHAGELTAEPSGFTLSRVSGNNGAHRIVVADSSFVPWAVSGTDQVIVEYRLQTILQSSSETLYVFDFSIR